MVFTFQSSFVERMLFAIVKKTMDQHVMPSLAFTTVMSASCDLWMSHDGVDIFIFWLLIVQ